MLKSAAAITALSAGRLALGPQPAAHAAEAHHDGQRPDTVSMAMHIHASWSEGPGSMEGHLDQATKTGIDVLFWTEHDFRMAEHGYPDVIHMTGPTETVNKVVWTWATQSAGTLATSQVAWDPAMSSPGDEAVPGSLHLAALSSGRDAASVGVKGSAANTVDQRSVYDQKITVDVFPAVVSPDSYLTLTVTTSWRPATHGRPAGQYTLTYIIDGTRSRSRTRDGITGTVHVPAHQGRWNTVEMRPEEDLARLWPDIEAADAAMSNLTLSAVSTRGRNAEGWFDLLRITRPPRSANAVLKKQAELMRGYAHRFPAVRQHQAMEVSLLKPTHFNWYGPRITMPTFAQPTPTADPNPDAAIAAIDMIHAAGGLASYNHPFGTSNPAVLPVAQQDTMRASVAASIVTDKAMGADILEVGYPSRGGVDLDHHAQVWDVCSRNGLFLTGTGVSDDHSGQDWFGQQANFVTWAYSKSRELDHLLPSLSSGNVFFGNPAVFTGTLGLLVDGQAPMGSVTVSRARTRNVRVLADRLPAGSTVRVVRGTVDLAGPGVPEPGTTFQDLPATEFKRGYVDLKVDTGAPTFVRVEVRPAGSATPVALSNPVWLLRDTPAGGIPRHRRVS
ncbi:hypothetical protein SAMN05421684_6234 [Asanoa ishikariensis]|uniref:Polymerase/histidinol phosphatase N-terminal domain-containing protein n=1 Tax=Asanoa ishikariensis TaxID=137265 RepID=A0A1H3TQR8_9ACTN|nr:hypothetical protein SAMN05421684_6234 [Asanoa ishikariensis]